MTSRSPSSKPSERPAAGDAPSMDLAIEASPLAVAEPDEAAAPAPPAIGIGTAAALGVLSSGASLVFSILRSKVTAVVLGPAGIGKSAEVLQLVSIGNLPATMMTGPALVSSVAEAARRGDRAAVERIARTAAAVALVASAAGGVLAVVAGLWLLPAPWGRGAWPLTLLAAAAALLSAWATIPQQILTAQAELKRLSAVRLAIAAASVALAVAGTVLFGLTGQFLALALSAGLSLLIGGVVLRRALGLRTWPSRAVDTAFIRRAARIGATAFIAGVAQQGVLFTIRWTLEAHGGAAENGQFQAAYAIGATYFSVVLDGIGTYVLPRYAAAQTPAELAAEMDVAARFVFRMAPPAILAAIASRELLVRALYSHRFDAAIDLVGLQMVGDMARSIAWVLASPLLYRNRIRAYLVTEVFAAAALAGGTVVLVPRYGLDGVGYAYMGMWVGHVVLTAIVVSRSCGVPLGKRRVATALALTGAAYAVLRLTHVHEAVRWVVLAGALVAWHRNGVLGAAFAKARRALSALGALRRRPGPAEPQGKVGEP
jgi:enterobacterial common antigen flippase